MSDIDFEQEISDRGFAGKLINRRARRLAGCHGFGRSDADDIAQELRLYLFRSLPQFDSSKGDWNAFAKAVVERRVATLICRRAAAKRGNDRPTGSLSVRVFDGDGHQRLADLIGPWHQQAINGRTTQSHTQQVDMAIDTERLVRALPRGLRRLCGHLKAKSLAEVTRKTRLPRTTLRSRLDRIREHFEAAGLTRSG